MISRQRILGIAILLVFGIAAASCIQRKPERIVKKDAPVTGELASIIEEDSALRVNLDIADTTRAKANRQHREIVYRLLAQALIVDPPDLYKAAIILQHADPEAGKECCLLAHKLALEAADKGYTRAKFLAAASLDRYLLLNGQPQRYGTQYTRNRAGQYVMLPYDMQIADSIRAAWGVPSMDSIQRELRAISVTKSKSTRPKTRR
jgi:hypothetical protein